MTKKFNFCIIIFYAFVIILFCLLFLNFVKKLYSGSDLSFSSFLNWLGNVNGVRLNVSITDFTILGDWGLFDGLRSFLNIFTTIFGVGVWFFSNLFNFVVFVSQFLYFIFA